MQRDTLKNNILDKIKMEFQKMFVPHRKAEIDMLGWTSMQCAQ